MKSTGEQTQKYAVQYSQSTSLPASSANPFRSFGNPCQSGGGPGSVVSLSVVVPVYNSEQSLPQLVRRLLPVLVASADLYEVILVNDGSLDGSWSTVCSLAQQFEWVRGINLMRNYGQHNALLCGVRAANYGVVVTLDDDLQHPPEEIPKLLGKLAEGFMVVYGTPGKLPHSWWRNMLSRAVKRLMARAMGMRTLRDISAFRAFRVELRQAFATYQSPDLLFDVLLSWGTTQFAAVEVSHEPRLAGKSNYTFRKLFNQAILMLTGYSTGPLRLSSLIGFGFTLFGIIVFIYVLLLYFLRGSIPGFPFLASIICLFSGAQLFALGIIGEYLARIFNRSLESPTYVVGATVDSSDEALQPSRAESENDMSG